MGKPSEATSIKPDRQIAVVRAKGVDSHIELLISEEQRVINVLLDDKGLIRLGLLFVLGVLFLFLGLIFTTIVIFFRFNWLLDLPSGLLGLI